MSYLNKIRNNREAILKGEIGALLHDIGKLHPDFVKNKSVEKIGFDYHAQIDKFLDTNLLNLIKNRRFEITLGSSSTDIYKLIAQHHERNGCKIDSFVKLLQKCDKKDSADDKGIVRKKQPLENTIIASPFGYPKERIELSCLQKRFNDLESSLIGLFKNYIYGVIDLSCFRESLISSLKTAFLHALGETRIPANDVTLWDHSYSTASLFKTALAAVVCGENLDFQKLKWRIFGICWDGVSFINKGRKIAEIQSRGEIIERVKGKLKRKFEDEIPVGNAIYEDTNGIYFTFPNLGTESKNLAKECAKEALEIVYKESDNELWPFFTLSKASGTLTIIANELKFASEKRKIPRMTPVLFVEGKVCEENSCFENPEIAVPTGGQDICPVCRVRSKDAKEEERCTVCEERRRGRLSRWLLNRGDTIWINEVADENNRIALISLSFYLDKWLDGTMIGTIYSQSFDDWLDKEKENLSIRQYELKGKIEKQIESLARAIEGMKRAKDFNRVKARISGKIQRKKELEQKAKQVTFVLSSTKKTVYKILEVFFEVKDNEKGIAVKILDTFFEENIGLEENKLKKHLTNIKERIGTNSLTKENLAAYLFTQNPSPARLYRIWRETEKFFDLVIREVKNRIYGNKWRRIRFSVNYDDLRSKLRQEEDLEGDTPYIIQVNNLEPQRLLVLYNKNGVFYTIESLGKFKSNSRTGEEAVKEALKQGFRHLAPEDKPDENLLWLGGDERIKPDENLIKLEEYHPLLEINKSPLSLRLIVPALDSMRIIELVTKLYNERFEKVLGKLPLNVKLLVAKRKFPLYILLDSESRMLEGEEFKKQVPMNPWWNIDGMRNDKYYGFYPTKPIKGEEKYTLDDLSSLSKGRVFYLYPGYFDFDLLLGTTDRYNICYENGKRGSRNYRLFTGRPYYFYQISVILELWDMLSNLPSSQISFIEEMLTSKIREWRNISDRNKWKVFREFAEATLKNAFSDNWSRLREETRFFLVDLAVNKLLLDAIILFKHVIKVKEVDESE